MTSSTSGVRVDLLRAARAELEEGGHANLSLRAVTRRAGLSHAAPKHHFGDRAGLLTAVAAEGFRELAAALDQVAVVDDGTTLLARLGRRYVRFALDEPALYDLMFRAELTSDDPTLQAARAASLGWLTAATNGAGQPGPPTDLTVVAWAFAHGVASLSREGLLPSIPLPGDDAASADLIGRFAALVTDAAAPPSSTP